MEGLSNFGHNLTRIINSILLFVVYIVGVGLTSIIAKLFRKHFLSLKADKGKKSYWSSLNLKKKNIDDYYRQF